MCTAAKTHLRDGYLIYLFFLHASRPMKHFSASILILRVTPGIFHFGTETLHKCIYSTEKVILIYICQDVHRKQALPAPLGRLHHLPPWQRPGSFVSEVVFFAQNLLDNGKIFSKGTWPCFLFWYLVKTCCSGDQPSVRQWALDDHQAGQRWRCRWE